MENGPESDADSGLHNHDGHSPFPSLQVAYPMRKTRLIGIVDDDASVREAISSLLRSAGFASAQFASGEAFLSSDRLQDVECLILDLLMPGLSGLEVQERLAGMNWRPPIIFATAHVDEGIGSPAFSGAAAVLQKPFSHETLIDAIRSCLRSGPRPSKPKRSSE
jgi:FixJ family two-component response regulator